MTNCVGKFCKPLSNDLCINWLAFGPDLSGQLA